MRTPRGYLRRISLLMWLLGCAAGTLSAQTGTLRGRVLDTSGAIVPGASVTVEGPSGTRRTTVSKDDGSYIFPSLLPGLYHVHASTKDKALAVAADVTIGQGATTADLHLGVVSTRQQVTVKAEAGPAVATNPAANAGALVLRGKDLSALADDPDDLASDLQALAGPSAGPNGGALFVDGFSGGELPTKDSISEIRINQNPFSPEYDTLGLGRIEIVTKPGADAWHGTGFYNFGDSVWNSRNPYAAEKAPFLLKEYGGNVTGPLTTRLSFSLDVMRASIDNGAIINGVTLEPLTLAIVNPYTDVFSIPQRRIVVTPRVDYRLTDSNTLTARFSISRSEIGDSGVGGFNLVSQGYDVRMLYQTLQLTDTAVLGANAVMTTRFQYFRPAMTMRSATPGAEVQVLNAFTGGGSPVGDSSDTQDNYEFQNYTSIERGKHSWRFGGRLRGAREDSVSEQNFNGTFLFGGGIGPVLDAANQPVIGPNGSPVLETITSIESYQRTLLFSGMNYTSAQIRALGGGATQYGLSTGLPAILANQFDAGLFVGDDWRLRRNLTLSLGLRYENQSNISDNLDFAPRFGLAWAPGASTQPKTVIRLGFGMFYDRFALANTITAQRYNGVTQKQYVISNPDFFPGMPTGAELAASQAPSAIQEVSSSLQAPRVAQTALAVERQLPGHTTLTLTYSNTHGWHELRSADINAPLPVTGLFPFGNPNPIFLMESSGLYNQNQFIVSVNSRVNQKVSLFGSYTYNDALSNTDGLLTFPSNPYSMAGEYGPAATDIRNRMTAGGALTGPWKLTFSPLLTLSSGPPFDIIAGQDIYGDTLFNARPAFATNPSKPGLIRTSYGLLDPNPSPGEPSVPRNYGRGPGLILANLRLARQFSFGAPGVPGGDARYHLSIGVSMRNLLNHNNPGPIIGNITSPLFGQANQPYGVTSLGGTGFSESADNRRFEVQTRFTF